MATLSSKSTFKLNSGHPIPVLAFGTATAQEKAEQESLTALRNGYTHLDTARIYNTEEQVGSAIRSSGIPRSQLFITSKVWDDHFTREDVISQVKLSLKTMSLEYIDLYLLHNPRGGPKARHQAWLGLQDAVHQGLVRSIGVSNFNVKHLEELSKAEGVIITPACNQLEFHPWNQQAKIIEYCQSKGVLITAFSALAQGKRMDDKVVTSLAEKYGKTKSQVILRWMVQHKGILPITKSSKEERVKETMEIFDLDLQAEDCERIDGLDEGMKAKIGDWDPDQHE
jgi:diketogulonate reductase-like aldo/keto reductase